MTALLARPLPSAPGEADGPAMRPPQGGVIPEGGYLLTTRFLRYVYMDDDASSCVDVPHVHREHVVLWSARGTHDDLEAEGEPRRLAPGQGLFVPAGVPHAASRAATTPLAAVFVDPARWEQAPPGVAAVVVNDAVRELLTHLHVHAMPKDQRLRAQRVCLELMTEAPAPSLSLPVPRDPRIAPVARAILADPSDDRSLEDWAFRTSVSTRTLVRAFRAETGMTFAQWRAAARMSAAVRLLGDGVPVGTVARRVGYATTSAFSAAFHRMLGRPPHRFLPGSGPLA
ncbi:AraC family transcriptional regulator [Brachybacterium sp. NBEC-018]|uniref:helix-turn-helix transcriptional regulator n=1 Tax=Brachybacterium sp. NBEC-018 TaxID=2996004 RepID=UPI0021756B08|nr:AraC family transcriptional regulator [Brachybacterium sp. NBEC-018]UVY84112.1 AraC family transcriptional regulator [Brachybacterium sp. NBEC-018]